MIAIGGSIGEWRLRLPVFWKSSVELPCARAWAGAGSKCQRHTAADVAHFPPELTFRSSFDYNVAHGVGSEDT